MKIAVLSLSLFFLLGRTSKTDPPVVEMTYNLNLDTIHISACAPHPYKVALIQMATELKQITNNPIPADTLAKWMYLVGCAESKFSTSAKYIHGTDEGIWQFNAVTRKTLTGSTRSIRHWTFNEQLDLYKKFMLKTKKFGKVRTLGDVYALNWLPARAHKYVLSKRGDPYYLKGRKDLNKDGYITKSELVKMLLRRTRKCTPFDKL